MSVADTIDRKIREALAPTRLDIVNESHMHGVPPGSESHFRLLIVSDGFAGKSPVERHRQVYEILSEEMAGAVHALGLQTMTPDEFSRRDAPRIESPECLGGSKV